MIGFNHDMHSLSTLSSIERQVVMKKKGRVAHYKQLVVHAHAPDQFSLMFYSGTLKRMELTESRDMQIKFYVNAQVEKFIAYWEDEGYEVVDRLVEHFYRGAIGQFTPSKFKRFSFDDLSTLSKDNVLISIPYGQLCIIEVGYNHAFSVRAYKAKSGQSVNLQKAQREAILGMLTQHKVECILLEAVITQDKSCVLMDVLHVNNTVLSRSYVERHKWLNKQANNAIDVCHYHFFKSPEQLCVAVRDTPSFSGHPQFGYIVKDNSSKKESLSACYGFIPQYYLMRVYPSDMDSQDSYALQKQGLKRVLLRMASPSGDLVNMGEMVCAKNADFSLVATSGVHNNQLMSPIVFKDRALESFLAEDTTDIFNHMNDNWYLNVQKEYRESLENN